MNDPIRYLDRTSREIKEEKVYGGQLLQFLYGNSRFSRIFGRPINFLLCRFSFVSQVVGWWQRLSITKNAIPSFIERYDINPSEFLLSPSEFESFNDFFIRKLKPEVRPIAKGDEIVTAPADGRYLFFQNLSLEDGFLVKGEKFKLRQFLRSKDLAKKYEQGSMVIARLCPSDYHRYHFPIDCTPGETHLINGYLYSVNPIAIKQNIHIFSQNKRVICKLRSETFGEVLFIEVGATNVGSIHQTYTPHQPYKKGDEKGYFSFGGSTLILLFEPNRIQFDQDLLEATKKSIEVRCLMGQQIAKATSRL